MNKERIPLVLLVLALMLIVWGSTMARAGDDIVVNLPMSIDAGADSVCSRQLLSDRHYAVQPTVNAYVTVSATGDGGLLWDGGANVNSDNVEVGAKKLYDVWTTYDKRYICCKPSANGAASNCKIYLYREGIKP